MTRLIVLVLVFVIVYLFARNVVRAFLRGLNLGNENLRGGERAGRKQEYRDVQDAEFKDITDEK